MVYRQFQEMYDFFFLLLLQIFFLVYALNAQSSEKNSLPNRLTNADYTIDVKKNASVLLTNKDGASLSFAPSFTILFSKTDPGLSHILERSVNFIVPSWKKYSSDTTTVDMYKAGGEIIPIIASKYTIKENGIEWQFTEHSMFNIKASLLLPSNKGEPRLTFQFMPKKEGWYSIGFTGAPETNITHVESIWQPLVWQELRFPSASFLSMENMCPLPAVMVGKKGVIASVVVDPSEVSFRLPVFENANFGVLVRNKTGKAQPQVFAPVFGNKNSKMLSGTPYQFSFRLLTKKGTWLSTYQYIAENMFQFHDYRKNGTATLNETIENMIDYAMNEEFSGWNKELKAFDYSTDVKGTVKLVSALHPLSIALITDNPEIYRRRALPMIEYLMSREKYLFSLFADTKNQNPSHYLKGPAAEVSELGALFKFSQKRSPVFSYYAEYLYDKPRALNILMVSEGASWQNSLALYRLNGDQKYLDKAISGAKEYIKSRITTPQKDFEDVHLARSGQFWTDFSPKWVDLLELYEETQNKEFLEASLLGARVYSSYVWLQPSLPDKDVTINQNTFLGMGDTHNKKKTVPMSAPTFKVPAWRVSQIGLTPEASNTYHLNPAVFLTHYAAYMLRLAHYTGDKFLKNIARSAVVGRYTNYPGYDINHEYTTIYQRPDYPLRAWEELTYNQIYYNHVWPHIALLTDYLITDAIYKSKGKIRFPSQYATGYAYLQTKVYGHEPGEFFADKGIWLWMPAKLLKTDNIQINYLCGRGNGNLYFSFLNQSDKDEKAKITLNPDIVPVEWSKTYKVRVWNGDQLSETTLKNGEIYIEVKAGDIISIAIEDIPSMTRYQNLVFDPSSKPLSEKSYKEVATPFGKLTGMILSMGKTLSSGYVWLQADEKILKQATIHYKTGNDWKSITDIQYPFEFSIPLEDEGKVLQFWVEGKSTAGEKVRGPQVVLEK